MKTKKHMALVLAVAAFLIVTQPQKGKAWFGEEEKDTKVAFIVVLDDSGAWGKRLNKRADLKKTKFFKKLSGLNNRKKTRNAVVDIISTASAESEKVTKTRDLVGEWEEIEEIMKGKPNYCNNVGKAFATLSNTIQQYADEGFDEIHAYVFSSLISIPAPCNQTKNLILPQEPPMVDWDKDGVNDLSSLLFQSPKLKSFTLLGVRPEQYQGWKDILNPRDWIKNNPGNVFLMKKFKQTDQALDDGLFVWRNQ